ncbi:MAG: DUF4238 domain-containing protein [Hyphomonas sp.]|nr:DUF4238 domain-containing protein [Hyphomonas sp.]
MSQPVDHHYLPRWYLDRWSRGGVVWEFRRQGPHQRLVRNYRSPTATGFAPHLYSSPELPSERAAAIETDFLQIVDARGARAMQALEAGRALDQNDHDALVEFVCSMLHRSPGRIAYLQKRLMDDLGGLELFEGVGADYFRHYALQVFLDLVQSDEMSGRLRKMRPFKINVGSDGFELLTSDRPLLLSDGLHHADAFVAMPIGPKSLLFLSERRSAAQRFAKRTARQLSRAVNDAIVRQAEGLVISQSGARAEFVDRRLGNPSSPLAGPYQEAIGLVRWQI